jgi:hypothetical protein
MGMALIEGTVFALAIGAYLYLCTRLPSWPPDGVAPPALRWGSVNTVVLAASLIPNELAKRAGERIDVAGVRLWMVVCLLFGISPSVSAILPALIPRRANSRTISSTPPRTGPHRLLIPSVRIRGETAASLAPRLPLVGIDVKDRR